MSEFSDANQYEPEAKSEGDMKESIMSGTGSFVDCGRNCDNDETNRVQVTSHSDAFESETCLSDVTRTATSNDDTVEGSIKFSPPLYKQRYERVCSILQQEEVTSVCDYGCAECRAICVFRSIGTVQRLVGVDIDRKLLVDHCRRLDPLIGDFLFRRCRPLHIDLFHGSLLDYDHRLEGIDAVTLIEVIEHLYEDDLEQLPAALFGNVAPRVVVITTPNAEFNVLFPSLVGFRHPDHKFEWTRSQFEQWCNCVVTKYSYDVVFGGVGDPPECHTAVGHCSQYAVFTRQETLRTEMSEGDSLSAPYSCIHVADYPAVYKPSSIEEAVLLEAQYYINMLVRCHGDNDDTDEVVSDKDDVMLIGLQELMKFSKLQQACNNDVELLRRVLVSADFKLSDDGHHILYNLISQSSSDVSDNDDDDDYLLKTRVDYDVTESSPAECWDC